MAKPKGTPGARFALFILAIILLLIILLFLAGQQWRERPSTPLKQASTAMVPDCPLAASQLNSPVFTSPV